MGIEILSRSRVLPRHADPWMDAFKLEAALADEKFGLLIVLDGMETIPKDLISCLSHLNHALVFQCVDLSDVTGSEPSPVSSPDGIVYVSECAEAESLDAVRERFPQSPCLIWNRPDPSDRKMGSRGRDFESGAGRHDGFLLALMRARLRLLRSKDRERGAAPVCGELYERLTRLTETQTRMLVAVLDGKPNKVIAFEFNISISTVKSHMSEVLRKLGYAQRASLIAQLGGWRTRDDLDCRICPHLAKFG